MRKVPILLAALAAAVALLCASPARAGFIVTVTDVTTGDTVTFTDTTPLGLVTGSGPGAHSGILLATGQNGMGVMSLAVGSYTIAFQTNTNNSPGTPAQANMAITNIVLRTTLAHVLTIHQHTTGGSFLFPASSTANVTAGLTATTFLASPSSNVMLMGGVVGGAMAGPITVTPAIANASQTVTTGSLPHPFDLQQDLTFTLSAGGSMLTQGSSITVTPVVPEPATMVLLLTGLPLVGAGAYLRRRRQQVAA